MAVDCLLAAHTAAVLTCEVTPPTPTPSWNNSLTNLAIRKVFMRSFGHRNRRGQGGAVIQKQTQKRSKSGSKKHPRARNDFGEEAAYESYTNPEPGFQSSPGDSVDAN